MTVVFTILSSFLLSTSSAEAKVENEKTNRDIIKATRFILMIPLFKKFYIFLTIFTLLRYYCSFFLSMKTLFILDWAVETCAKSYQIFFTALYIFVIKMFDED